MLFGKFMLNLDIDLLVEIGIEIIGGGAKRSDGTDNNQ
jgi:hypothetical protein